MQLNNPAVVAELTRLHTAYERALIENDVPTLDSFFWDSPHAVRYGATENLYGSEAIRIFRQNRPKINLEREIQRLEIVSFGDNAGIINLDFIREINGKPRRGRQSQVWMRLGESWKIVSAHVSLIPEETSYIDTAAAQLSLPIAAEYRPAVEEDFRRIASVAQILLQFPLDQSIEESPVFRP